MAKLADKMTRHDELVGPEWLQSKQKRAMDLALLGMSTPLIGPMGIATLSATLLSGENQPLFWQQRMYRDGEQFGMPKIKTLEGEIDSVGSQYGHTHDRSTLLGKLLRPTHIDEIPQMILIARGTMSINGRRPLLPHEHEETMDLLSPPEQIEWKHSLTLGKPGVASLYMWYRFITGSKLDLYEKAVMDTAETHSATMRGDLEILARCIAAPAVRLASSPDERMVT